MVHCVQSTTMNIIWTLLVCTACLLSDVVGETSDDYGFPKSHNVLVLFRNGSRHEDVANFCRGVQVRYVGSGSQDLAYSYTITSAECLDFPANGKASYPLHVLNNEEEYNTGYAWPINGDMARYVKHPKYNKETKEHNIAVFLHKRVLYEKNLVSLPEREEVFEGKSMVIGKWSDKFGQNGSFFDPHVENLPTKAINSKWCEYLHPFSPLRGFGVCLSGWTKRYSQVALGDTLIYKDEQKKTKLAGLATIAGPHPLSFPIEFMSIQPYVIWLQNEAKTAYNV